MPTTYPCVPGHEIVGRVTKVESGHKSGYRRSGRLGHMAVKLAKAIGAHVVVFTTSENKRLDALRLDADEVVLSRNKEEMGKCAGTLEIILDCIAAERDVNAYLSLLTLELRPRGSK